MTSKTTDLRRWAAAMAALAMIGLAGCGGDSPPWPPEKTGPTMVWQTRRLDWPMWEVIKLYPDGSARRWFYTDIAEGFEMQMGDYRWTSPTLTLRLEAKIGSDGGGVREYHAISMGGTAYLAGPEQLKEMEKGFAFRDLNPYACPIQTTPTLAADDATLMRWLRESRR